MKLLLVEDEVYALEDLKASLLSIEPRLQIKEAANAREALDALESEPYDGMLLDLELPGMDGIELLRSLQPIRLPVVLCTAHALTALDAFGLGVIGCLLKPIDRDRLAGMIRELTRRIECGRTHSPDPVAATSPCQRKVCIQDGDLARIIGANDVLFFEEENGKTRITSQPGSGFISDSLNEIAGRLDSSQFMRVSDRILINLSAVDHLQRKEGVWYAHFPNGKTLPIGTQGIEALKRIGLQP